MTSAGGIIIWTLISFVLVASQDTGLQGEKGAVCNVRVPRPKTDFVWNYEECENYLKREEYRRRGKICALKPKDSATLWFEQKCCEGYENKTSICEPQCSPKCEDGEYCAKPNKCDECLPGWTGQNCNESLWCVVKVNLTPTLRNLPVKVPYNDTSTKWKRPECLPKCRDEAANISVIVAESTNMKRYFVPIESSCNIEADFQDIPATFKYHIIGSLGIVLAIIILGIVCVVRRKQKRSIKMDDKPAESGNEYVFNRRPPLEEPTESEYDYVCDHRGLPEEPTDSEYDYVYGYQLCPIQRMQNLKYKRKILKNWYSGSPKSLRRGNYHDSNLASRANGRMQTNPSIIIIFTTIVLAAVASEDPVLDGGKGAVCNETVNETVARIEWNNEGCGDIFWRIFGKSCTRIVKNYTSSSVKLKCCKGYENKSSECVPRCSPQCRNGHCAKPSECRCDSGWGGNTCDSPRWCVLKFNSTPTISKLPVDVPVEDTLTEWKGPECLPECRDQVFNLSINVAESGSMSYYSLPIESPCNIRADSEILLATHKYQIIGSLGIVLSMMIIFHILIVRKRKRISTVMNEDPTEYEYDSICKDQRLSEKPTECEYDYVYNHRLCSTISE